MAERDFLIFFMIALNKRDALFYELGLKKERFSYIQPKEDEPSEKTPKGNKNSKDDPEFI